MSVKTIFKDFPFEKNVNKFWFWIWTSSFIFGLVQSIKIKMFWNLSIIFLFYSYMFLFFPLVTFFRLSFWRNKILPALKFRMQGQVSARWTKVFQCLFLAIQISRFFSLSLTYLSLSLVSLSLSPNVKIIDRYFSKRQTLASAIWANIAKKLLSKDKNQFITTQTVYAMCSAT